MTLIGLLLRGMADGDDGSQIRQALHHPAAGGASLVPAFPPPDVQGSRWLRPNRGMQHLLEEVVQIIASDLPTEGASSCRESRAPQ